ncbi:putative heat shock protein 70 family protein [Tanacetum coccineum]
MEGAMGLMRRMPPKHTQTALSALLSLLPDHSADLLSQIDQPLQVPTFTPIQSNPKFPANELSSNVVKCVPSGIRPTRWFCDRSKTSRPLIPARLCGIFPVSWFEERSNDSISDSLPRESGIRPFRQGPRTTPSAVVFLETDRLIGEGAKNQVAMNPASTIFDAKRLIGRKFSDSKVQEDVKLWPFKVIQGLADTPKIVVTYKGQNKEFLAEEVSSMILGKMKEIAEAYLGKEVKKCSDNRIDFSMRITRAKFEELNISLFDKCIKILEKCLTDAKMEKSWVDEIILVGGSTRIPKVQHMLREFFDGKELCKSVHPDEAIAYGAAIIAAKLTETYVYKGERSKSTDNHLLGMFLTTGIPPAPKAEIQFKDCFDIDADGILTVTSQILSAGIADKLTISNENGRLSKEEIERMIKDAEKYKLEDQEYKKRVKSNSTRIRQEKLEGRMEACHLSDVTRWLDDNQGASIDELQHKKKFLESVGMPLI